MLYCKNINLSRKGLDKQHHGGYNDPTRPDPTRPDPTRPDPTVTHGLKSVKAFLKKHDPFHILTRLNSIRFALLNAIRSIPWRKDKLVHNHSGSKQFDKTPYIIRRQDYGGAGLFSCFFQVLGGIAYADKNNMHPVVDMKNCPNQYLYSDEIGRKNSWEYFFEQPDGISLDEALNSEEYILSRDTSLFEHPHPYVETLYNMNGELDYWRELCRKYIHFKPAVIDRLEKLEAKYSGKRILGVLARGTDFVAVKLANHPVPPTAEQAIAKTREVMKEKGFDAVYLATEDKRILAKFQEAFGEKLLLPEADYLNYDYDNPKLLSAYHADRTNDKYIRGLEYLVSMLFLSKCPGLITARTGGAAGVVCFSEGFEYLYAFDLGVYK